MKNVHYKAELGKGQNSHFLNAQSVLRVNQSQVGNAESNSPLNIVSKEVSPVKVRHQITNISVDERLSNQSSNKSFSVRQENSSLHLRG